MTAQTHRHREIERIKPWSISFFIFLLSVFRLWPSDRLPIVGALAYVPTPLLLVAACTTALFLFIRYKRFYALQFLLILAPLAIIAWENRGLVGSDASSNARDSLRVFHWNIWGARRGIEPIMSEIRKLNPDIICLSEHWQHKTRKRLPYIEFLDGSWHEKELKNILILSRLPLINVRNLSARGVYGIYAEVGRTDGFSFLFLDASPNFGYFRHASFSDLLDQMRSRPHMILGDFNTPPLSYSIRSTFGESHRDVYGKDAGQTGYTWPSWFPMLRIDLMLTSGRYEVDSYRTESSNLSDHRWQYADVSAELNMTPFGHPEIMKDFISIAVMPNFLLLNKGGEAGQRPATPNAAGTAALCRAPVSDRH